MLTMIFIVMTTGALLTWMVFHGVLTWVLRHETFVHAEAEASPAESGPMVSVLIPAHNEERNIRPALEALARQRYPHFEVIVVDDRSTDATARIVGEVSEADARVRLMQVTEIPNEWVGKAWALQQASVEARGEVLLFLDADVRLDPGGLQALVAHFTENRLDMMSLFLRHEPKGPLDAAVHLLMGAILNVRCLPSRVNRPDHRAAFATGQDIMMRADVYRALGGHAPVRSLVQEDVGFARLFKQEGRRIEVAYGFDVGSGQWYGSLGEMLRGWTRIFFGVLRGNVFECLAWAAIIAWLAFVPCCAIALGTIALIVEGWALAPTMLLALGAAAVAAQEYLMLRLHRMVRYERTCLAMHIPAAMVVFVVALSAIGKRLAGRDMVWRGNRYGISHELRKAS